MDLKSDTTDEQELCHTSVTILEMPPKGSRTAMPLSKKADAARSFIGDGIVAATLAGTLNRKLPVRAA